MAVWKMMWEPVFGHVRRTLPVGPASLTIILFSPALGGYSLGSSAPRLLWGHTVS